MITGNRIARELAEKRRDLESNLRAVSVKLDSADTDLARLLKREGELWQRYAVIQIGDSPVLPQPVQAALDKRASRINREHAAIDEANARIALLDQRRAPLVRSAEGAAKELQAAREKASTAFSSDPAAVATRQKFTHTQESVDNLLQKKARADTELENKGSAYLADPLFGYLHNKDFGSATSGAGGLIGRLDSWLANVTDYRKQAANLRRMEDVARWIGGRIEMAVSERDALGDELVRLESEHYSFVLPIEKAAEEAENALQEIETEIARHEDVIHRANAFITDAARAADDEMKKVLRTFTDLLASKGIRDIADAARSTATDEDDRIAHELGLIEREKSEIRRNIDNLRPGIREFEKRLTAVREVETRLRNRSWNHSGDDFSSSLRLSRIEDLANGAITAAAMWGMIESAYRRPPAPSYSSSGNSGFGDGFGGGFGGGSSSGGGFGGGSWSSGGGFGGGGSSTGGGF